MTHENVYPFIGAEADFLKDLDQLEGWIEKSPEWSPEKYHYLHLVAQMSANEVISDKVRLKACYIICEHSDAAKAFGDFYGVNTAEEMKKALGCW